MATDELKLLGELKASSVYAAILGSFNVHFPFLEQVVQPALRAKGCHHQLVLADARKCAEVATDPEVGPLRAGSDYCLIPVAAPRAFHPKFMLLLGAVQSRVFVGSHNLTLSGFGLNREVTSRILVRPGDGSQAIAAGVFQFARRWTEVAAPDLVELLDACVPRAPWLMTANEAPDKCALVATHPDGPSLWEQLRNRLGAGVRRVTVLGPYFDQQLRFLKTISDALSPTELIVAVSPEHSEIPADAAQLIPDLRWVDLTDWGDASGRFVHAKVLLFELHDGTRVLVTGSANPSAPAWLGEPSERNAELVVVRDLVAGDSLPTDLGLEALAGLPLMTDHAWGRVATRQAQSTPAERPTAKVWVAVEEPSGFRVPVAFATQSDVVTLVHAGGAELGQFSVSAMDETSAFVAVDDKEARSGTARLSQHGGHRVALVHHLAALRELATDERARSLRSALLDLSTSDGGLEKLIATVEKAIFDGVVAPTRGERSAAGEAVTSADGEKAAKGTVGIGPLATTLRRQARIASGDLALILDALIRRLGDGLPLQDAAGISPTSEEEVNESTRLADPPHKEGVDGHAMALVCQRKTRTLMSRMRKRLENSLTTGDCARAVVQLAATMGLLRQLRARESTLAWLSRGDGLVEGDAQWEFFTATARLLYLPGGVADAAVAEVGAEFPELRYCAGLALWCSYDCGLDRMTALVSPASGDGDDAQIAREQQEERLTAMAMLLRCLDQPLPDVDERVAILGDVGAAWLSTHLEWRQRLGAEGGDSHGPIAPGAVVRWGLGSSRMLSVVVATQGDKVTIVDLSGGGPGKPIKAGAGTKVFKAARVAVVGALSS